MSTSTSAYDDVDVEVNVHIDVNVKVDVDANMGIDINVDVNADVNVDVLCCCVGNNSPWQQKIQFHQSGSKEILQCRER